MNSSKPTKTFWIISCCALVWNLIDVFFFMNQSFINSTRLAELSPEEAELFLNTPQLLKAIFSIATVTGLLGSIFLLILRKAATTLFLISLIAEIIEMSYALLATEAFEVYGIFKAVIVPLVIIIVAFSLYIFSKKSAAKGYLRVAS